MSVRRTDIDCLYHVPPHNDYFLTAGSLEGVIVKYSIKSTQIFICLARGGGTPQRWSPSQHTTRTQACGHLETLSNERKCSPWLDTR